MEPWHEPTERREPSEAPQRPKRDFKGIWIPKEIWLSEALSLMEKVLFVEIHSLDNEHGCYASNKYFAEFFGVSDRQIRTYLASLKEKGFITVMVRAHNHRVIRTAGRYRRIPDEELRRLRTDTEALARKMRLGSQRHSRQRS